VLMRQSSYQRGIQVGAQREQQPGCRQTRTHVEYYNRYRRGVKRCCDFEDEASVWMRSIPSPGKRQHESVRRAWSPYRAGTLMHPGRDAT
jgi:hypothetical protein